MTTYRSNKTSNVYADYLSPRLYASTPKAVFAAMAVSIFLNRDGAENRASLDAAVLEEWSTLHAQRIVPQKPPTASAGDPDGEDVGGIWLGDPTEEQVNDWNIANDHQDRGVEAGNAGPTEDEA